MFRHQVASTLFAAALLSSTSLLAPTALYANEVGGKDPVATAASKAGSTEHNLMKLSHDGHDAMRAVRGARMAIFNGEPEMVTKMLEEAKNSLDAAEEEAPKYSISTEIRVDGTRVENSEISGKVDMIAIDGEISVADNFVVTPEKTGHVDKANEHFKTGEHKEALEQLRLAEIDVSYVRAMISLSATKKHVETAIALEAEHRYYEANLALKAAEEGLVFDTVTLVEVPKEDGAAKTDTSG